MMMAPSNSNSMVKGMGDINIPLAAIAMTIEISSTVPIIIHLEGLECQK